MIGSSKRVVDIERDGIVVKFVTLDIKVMDVGGEGEDGEGGEEAYV